MRTYLASSSAMTDDYSRSLNRTSYLRHIIVALMQKMEIYPSFQIQTGTFDSCYAHLL